MATGSVKKRGHGNYVLWFLLVLAAGKILACSLTLGIGGSGGVFAPSLFVGVTSGMALGELADQYSVRLPAIQPSMPSWPWAQCSPLLRGRH
ncbi:MAG TPA: chloride channel protein [Streptosporangiaceae bacterium]|nr:chloride channel protein [Streptosporangiaceae bacterium]